MSDAARPAGDDTAPPVGESLIARLRELAVDFEHKRQDRQQRWRGWSGAMSVASSDLSAVLDNHARAAAGPRAAGGGESRDAAVAIREALAWEDAPAVTDPDGVADFLSGWFSGADYALVSAVAGPRAGDTAPDDGRSDSFTPNGMHMTPETTAAERQRVHDADEIIRLRSDVAALRDAGDALVERAGGVRMVNGALCGIDDLNSAADTWRSTAGPAITDEPRSVTVALPATEHDIDGEDEHGRWTQNPGWETRGLESGLISAWAQGVSVEGTLHEDGDVLDLEETARKVLAAVVWHRHYAAQEAEQ